MEPNRETSEAPLWTFVPPREYRLPSDTVERSVRTRISAFWQNLRKPETAAAQPPEEREQLKRLPPWLLDQLAPLGKWQGAADVLAEALAEGFLDRPEIQAVAVVGAPYSGHAEMLGVVAARKKWTVIAPPAAAEILAGGDGWCQRARETAARGPWVILGLEKCFLRHPRGLEPVRRLLAEVKAGRLGSGIIACGSWAWAYLEVAAGADILPAVTPQALDAEGLFRWLGQLPAPQAQARYSFRLAGSREALFPEREANEALSPDKHLTELAACSRGIGGVALGIWRHSLRTMPEDPAAAPAPDSPDDARDGRQAIQVLPRNALQLPSVTSVERPAGDFVLHSLLLHNGLSEELLLELLPLPRQKLLRVLFQLHAAGVLTQAGDVWHVSPLGYPAVKIHMQDRNFLTDPF